MQNRFTSCPLAHLILVVFGSLGLLSLVAAPVRAEEPIHMAQNDPISVDFPDESLPVLLRNVADLYELNLTIPVDMPDTRVSLKLRNVTWRQIFSEALSATDYTFVENGTLVRLVKKEDPQAEMARLKRVTLILLEENLRNRQIIARLANPAAPPLSDESRRTLADYAIDIRQRAEPMIKRMAAATPENEWTTENEITRQLVGSWQYEGTDGDMPCRCVSTFHPDGGLKEEILLTDSRFQYPIRVLLEGFWNLDASNSVIRTLITTSSEPSYFKPGRARDLKILALEADRLRYRVGESETIVESTRQQPEN